MIALTVTPTRLPRTRRDPVPVVTISGLHGRGLASLLHLVAADLASHDIDVDFGDPDTFAAMFPPDPAPVSVSPDIRHVRLQIAPSAPRTGRA